MKSHEGVTRTVTPEGADTSSMTVREVASTLRLSPRTVRRYVKRGDFPNWWRTHGALRIPTADVDAFKARSRES